MEQKRARRRTAVFVTAAGLLALTGLLAAVLLTIRGGTRSTIVLPEPALPAAPEQETELVEPLFLEVDRTNIQKILATMRRPTAYHQSLTVTAVWPGGSSSSNVELYRSGDLFRAEVTGGGAGRTLLTNGETVWLWYADGGAVRALEPEADVRFDDLIGIPTYETVAAIAPDKIEEAGFVTLEGASCLYVSTRDGAYEERYWVDASTQLLCRADALENEQLTYQLRQTLQEVLSEDDAALEGLFQLPDGTRVS